MTAWTKFQNWNWKLDFLVNQATHRHYMYICPISRCLSTAKTWNIPRVVTYGPFDCSRTVLTTVLNLQLPFYVFWHQSILCYSPQLFSICEIKHLTNLKNANFVGLKQIEVKDDWNVRQMFVKLVFGSNSLEVLKKL